MSSEESMFLVEIKVEELNSYIECKEFTIKAQFSNIFLLKLRDPNDFEPLVPKIKSNARKVKTQKDTDNVGQSILFTSRRDTLITAMKKYPIELTLHDKRIIDKILGSIHIPWSPIYIEFLEKVKARLGLAPATTSCSYNIYNDVTSTCMATIRLNIILKHLKNKVASFRSLCEANYPQINTESNLKQQFNTTTASYTTKKSRYDVPKNRSIIQPSIKRQKFTRSDRPEINVKMSTNTDSKGNPFKPIEKLKRHAEKYFLSHVKSDTYLYKHRQVKVSQIKSSSALNRKSVNILNYIFGDIDRPVRGQVLYVGYFTLENDFKKSESSNRNTSFKENNSDESDFRGNREDLPEDAAYKISHVPCLNSKCRMSKQGRKAPPQPDDRIQLKIKSSKNDSFEISETTEKVVGGVNANMKFDRDDCFCSCECTIEFIKRTTYCGICGGYERPGEDMSRKIRNAPFPCPIYHKLFDKTRQKTLSTSGSDRSKNKGEESLKRKNTKPLASGGKLQSKEKKKRKDSFRCDYGYKAPKFGHIRCAAPCTGTLGAVPKHMGWLWTADDVPGIKFRPNWRPGASNKHVVRALKVAKNPDTIIKKKKKDTGKKKISLKRPLLTVAKKNGEYTVTMETMKIFARPRAPNQYPYEDKPLLTYTVGRTDEENRERQKKKDRAKRRLERDQRNFIQSTFKNMCKEICLKTYQQALSILPDGEDPDCLCYPKYPGPDDTNLDHSCSCSEDSKIVDSDTDSDEWIVEFTPPNATFNPSYTGKRLIKIDHSSQYTYEDYRVKLLDRYGNQVPRFFKGPDGKTQCSDLGGFWNPDHKWLEINTDGYIGPDGRWAPMSFIGPNGELVDCDNGKFQVGNSGIWLVVGIDGYIDSTGKWKFYQKPKSVSPPKKHHTAKDTKVVGIKNNVTVTNLPSEVAWSCFADANVKDLSKMGLFGHGQDRKLLLHALNDLVSRGEDIKIPLRSTVSQIKSCKKSHRAKSLEYKCKHSRPSSKGIVAIDGHGHKTYFKLKDYKSRRSNERIIKLTDQGISLSSFHAPCFHSFISREIMKKQLLEKRMKMAKLSEYNDSLKSEYVNTYSPMF